MTGKEANSGDKQVILQQYRDLVIATLDYYLDNNQMKSEARVPDTSSYFHELKTQAEAHFQKGRLSLLKQWFRDLTEMPIETRDLKFNQYLLDKTGYAIDVFSTFFQRIDKVIVKGKISSDNQYYDIKVMVDHLCQTLPVDAEKLGMLSRLLIEYEERKVPDPRKGE